MNERKANGISDERKEISMGLNDINPNEKTICGIECVLVKAGTFTMGSPSDEDKRQINEEEHEVTIKRDYYISKYPITKSLYEGDTTANADCPVEYITWAKALDWAKSKGGRLPTEAEWEFAARGGRRSKGYYYCGSNALDDVAWFSLNSTGQTHPVGQKRPNELGIYDMSGNVFEWCSDWFGEYPLQAATNPKGPKEGDARVMRGGSCCDAARDCRIAYRGMNDPDDPDALTGFRVVFDVVKKQAEKQGEVWDTDGEEQLEDVEEDEESSSRIKSAEDVEEVKLTGLERLGRTIKVEESSSRIKSEEDVEEVKYTGLERLGRTIEVSAANSRNKPAKTQRKGTILYG